MKTYEDQGFALRSVCHSLDLPLTRMGQIIIMSPPLISLQGLAGSEASKAQSYRVSVGHNKQPGSAKITKLWRY